MRIEENKSLKNYNTFGIDLGTNNIKIYSKNEDKITVSKNMIAIENKKNLFVHFLVKILAP